MVLDIRLDFITKINSNYIDLMTNFRKQFIAIDKILMGMAREAQDKKDAAAQRAIDIARTNNEAALQAAIKSLCILGEVKEA